MRFDERRRAAVLFTPLLILAAAAARADTYPRQPGVDILHYTFRLELSDTTDAIEGRTTVTCRVVEDGLETLVLDLAQPKPPPADRGMTVGSVTEAGKALSFEHAGDRLTIRLAPAGRARDVRRIDVAYRGVPATGLLIAPTKHGERSFFSDNWPIKARQWLPTLDHPYDKATSEMIVTAPAHYQVVSNGRLVEDSERSIARQRTEIGMVFQRFNLFPHKTALGNVIEAPIRVLGTPESRAVAEAEALLERVGLADKRDVYPGKLSGGQQQRVAIARALAMKPALMLFDEPTSALDPEMRDDVMEVIRDLASTGMTMLVVTHEMQFAHDIASRVWVIDQGTIVEDGPPAQVVDAPRTAVAREFFARIRR